MGTKQRDIASFLESECQGFIYDTARSFIDKHSNEESLLGQLKGLYTRGKYQACKDLIQLVFEQRHSLSGNSEIMLLRAQMAFEENDSTEETLQWIRQAELNNKDCHKTKIYKQVLKGQQQLREGLYQQGESLLTHLLDSEYQAHVAFALGDHLFWKNQSTEEAIALLKITVRDRPGFVRAWATMGFAYNKMGLKDKAQQSFAQCLEFETDPERVAFYKQQLAS